MAEWLERAVSGRSTCRTCQLAIAKGTLRVAEEDFGRHEVTVRFHHLRCVLGDDLSLAHRAVLASQTPRELRPAAMAEIEAEAPALAATLRASPARSRTEQGGGVSLIAPPPPEPFRPRELELIARLSGVRDDRASWAVLGDALSERGDPRGELISLDLSGRDDAEAAARRLELQGVLAPERRNDERSGWSKGFVSIYRLHAKHLRPELFAHPSLAMLRELEIDALGAPEELPSWVWPALPRSLSTLILKHVELGPLERVPSPPGLVALTLHDCGGGLPFTAGRSPAVVTSLAIVHWRGELSPVETLVRSGLLVGIRRLALHSCALKPSDVRHLAKALNGRRLEALDVSWCRGLEASHPELEALCESLVGSVPAPVSAGQTAWVHTGKPEWGTAREVSRRGGMLELEFEHAPGRKRFKLGSPFLAPTKG